MCGICEYFEFKFVVDLNINLIVRLKYNTVWRIVCKDNIVYTIHRIIMFVRWISSQDVAYASYLIFSFYTAMYPESRRFGGSRQSRTFVNIDPPPSARKGHTRSVNVCLRFLEALMRFANRRLFDNYTLASLSMRPIWLIVF